MINQTVLMSDAHNFRIDYPINPYYGADPVDPSVAQAEHDAIRAALEEAGITVITTSSPETSQDGVYTANWGLVRGDKVVLSRLPEVRRSEESYAREVLESLGKEVIDVPEGLKFSGQGDALPCGKYLLCGSTYRSDEEAQKFAADELGFTRIQLETIPQRDGGGNIVVNKTTGWIDSFFYDVDLSLAVIKEPTEDEPGLIAYCPEAFTEESRRKLEALEDIELIVVSMKEAQEAFALNLVSTGDTVIMSDSAPGLLSELKSRGLKVITPSITELSKGGGYIRCTTLTLN